MGLTMMEIADALMANVHRMRALRSGALHLRAMVNAMVTISKHHALIVFVMLPRHQRQTLARRVQADPTTMAIVCALAEIRVHRMVGFLTIVPHREATGHWVANISFRHALIVCVLLHPLQHQHQLQCAQMNRMER